ncbi:MAG: acetyltransferase [Caldilineales bacterium]|nr:acetyltransferase [Caldilineales bacterium]
MERDAAADLVDTALLAAALTAYENARMDGLCHAGAWECALTILQGAKTDERR